uniref:FYVE domain-containing protein n=1 Tax=Macrostomum lignano TaxID=282301 RepID=A0A1I8JPT7_9PLAT
QIPGSRHGIRDSAMQQSLAAGDQFICSVLRSIAEVPQQRSLMVLWCLEAGQLRPAVGLAATGRSTEHLLLWRRRASKWRLARLAQRLETAGQSQPAMLQVLRRKLFLPHGSRAAELLSGITPQDQELVGVAQQIKRLDADKQQDRVSELIGELKECQQRVMKLMLELMNELIPRSKASERFPYEIPRRSGFRRRLEGQPMVHPRRREDPPPAPLTRPAAVTFGASPGRIAGCWTSGSNSIAFWPRGGRAVSPETAAWALAGGHIRRDDIDECEPTLMIVLPRLAVLATALLLASSARWFRAFHSHLDRVRSFLGKLKQPDMDRLVRRLCLTESGDATDAESGYKCSMHQQTQQGTNRRHKQCTQQTQQCTQQKQQVIAGVADQIQSNYAWELRYLLRCVLYNLHCSEAVDEAAASAAAATATLAVEEGLDAFDWQVTDSVQSASTLMATAAATGAERRPSEPPAWVPDSASDVCTNRRCGQAFTITRRRHHCRPVAACSARPAPGLGEPCPSSDSTVPSGCATPAASPPAAVNENNGDRA